MPEYKKSYKGLIFSIIGYVAVMVTIALLPLESRLLTVLTVDVTVLWIVLLAYIIYKTEAVYWYSGMYYEDALKAGSDRRKIYALKHLKRFGLAGAISIGISIFGYLGSIPGFVIVLIVWGIIVAASISTMGFKL